MDDAFGSLVSKQVKSFTDEIKKKINLIIRVKNELDSIFNTLETIKNFLHDAEIGRFSNTNINKWLIKLEDTSYEMEDILDEWHYDNLKPKIELNKSNTQLKVPQLNPSSALCCLHQIFVRHDTARKIEKAKDQLELIFKEKDQFQFAESQHTNHLASPSHKWRKVQSTSLINLEEVQGRDSDKEELVSKIICKEAGLDLEGFRVVSIVGAGGLGKTTLAQLVYNDSRVKGYFDLRVWMCVSDPFDENQIAKEIIKTKTDTMQLDILLKQVIDCILGKKFFLVLDDVWVEDDRKWEPLRESLKKGKAGSIVMVTTRNQNVAKLMDTMDDDIYRLKYLSTEDCYMLLSHTANISQKKEVNSGDFESIGRRIAHKCKGLPLAAKVLGGLLRDKNKLGEWENILNNEIWQLNVVKVDLFPHLLLSYNKLSLQHKRCFLYCAVFPKDSCIDVRNLIDCWRGLGYFGSSFSDQDLTSRECFDILVMHSLLIQDFTEDHEYCKMHDIVHDFAQYLRKNGRVMEGSMQNTKTCQSCSSSLLITNNVKEYRSLFWKNEQGATHLCRCLRSLRVLQISECYPKLETIPQELRYFIHLRWLDLSHNNLPTADLTAIFKLYNLQSVDLSWCDLRNIPTEIGNLTHLRVLRLHGNRELTKLPEIICSLLELRILDVGNCNHHLKLPEGIHRLTNLKYLCNWLIYNWPQGLAQLTGLREMTDFYGGSGWNKLRLLKNLNNLGGIVYLHITINSEELGGVVEDARGAEMMNKKHIKDLRIVFDDKIRDEESSMMMDVINALQPHSNLQKLTIKGFKGSKLPTWLQTLNLLRRIVLLRMDRISSSLLPLWKLSCLEVIDIASMGGLKSVGREFLGITTIGEGGDHVHIAFPKLKKLLFSNCLKWKVWEDITNKDEEKTTMSLMPCLIELHVTKCPNLTELPHRLLHQAPSLKRLIIGGSFNLKQLYYRNQDTSPLKSLHELTVSLTVKTS